jgi:hypothetical protein
MQREQFPAGPQFCGLSGHCIPMEQAYECDNGGDRLVIEGLYMIFILTIILAHSFDSKSGKLF